MLDIMNGINKNLIMEETWGHLAPKPNTIYPGTLVFAQGDYGNLVPLKTEFKNLPGSPWFFNDMQDFINKKAKTAGHIYKFTGTYRLLKNGKGRFSGTVQDVTRTVVTIKKPAGTRLPPIA